MKLDFHFSTRSTDYPGGWITATHSSSSSSTCSHCTRRTAEHSIRL